MFENKDIQQMQDRGMDVGRIRQQLENFKTGFPPLKLESAATQKKGIVCFSGEEANKIAAQYDAYQAELQILKFVPASGAASRMFKSLLAFAELSESDQEKDLIEKQDINSVYYFFQNIEKFAFYKDLEQALIKDGLNVDSASKSEILSYLLSGKGLSYASLPKALLAFHQNEENVRLSIEEHLVEGALYAKSDDNIVRIHFTLSQDHIPLVQKLMNEKLSYYESKFKIKYEIEYSIQNPATDTIAVDSFNQPFREKDGSIVFRPGGHGALIDNLQALNADLIFIKNIDNVVPDRLKDETVLYKKVIGAHLIQLQDKIYNYLDQLDDNQLDNEFLHEIESFMEKELMFKIPASLTLFEAVEKADYLFEKLNRPIRVCGMVKNEGEPGGGPFWVQNSDSSVSLQIVESSQIDLNDLTQEEIMKAATHFNPVDLVCSITDFRGNTFDLNDFIDPNTAFVSHKSKEGKELKALELPGLWNGAMADWNTVFVEVPIETFNPVKIVNDLLRPQHQSI
ncbi:MAG: DUF4301 family protein [Bacteroidetes bacterium]|nr:DUF4301 family protein [Bacteroidota bacterium]